MNNLFEGLIDKVVINGKTYDLHLWFDSVLKFFELMQDNSYNDIQKMLLAFDLFVDARGDDIPIEAKVQTVQTIVTTFVIGEEESTSGGSSGGSGKQAYDLNQDAKYIYASFMQEYGIDLIEEQGNLRWEKFTALMAGLRDKTKFQEIIGIRLAKIPTGKGTEQEAKRLRELKKVYALKRSQHEVEEEMNAMFNQYLTGGKIK